MESLAVSAKSLFGVSLSSAQIQAFELYATELMEWNRRMNLTSVTDPEGIRNKHFLDSLSCLTEMRLTSASRIVDIGTGAGFPGLPLKIAVPKFHLSLVEATGKKTEFCRHIVERLQLSGVEVIHARAEDLGRDERHREKYDWAVARAVADLPVLAEYLLPLMKVGGHAIAQKGENGPAEAQAAMDALHLLGGAIQKVAPIELPGVSETRYLIVIAKRACTPERYPRRVGVPSKQPLGNKKIQHRN